MDQLGFLGFKLDEAANQRTICGKTGLISQSGSTTALVVNTNEELLIAQDTAALVGLGY
jgi:acetate kinase